MHVGAIMIFEGPPPPIVDLVEHIRRRLQLVPRFRQKLALPPLDSGRPLWVDDVNFNLEYHMRHTALPEPGGGSSCAAGRRGSSPSSSTAPSRSGRCGWSRGCEDDRFALLTKTHHAMVDGISGVDIGTVLFDLAPEPPPDRASGRPWLPHAGAGHDRAAGAALAATLRAGPMEMAERAVEAVATPSGARRARARRRRASARSSGPSLNPAPDVPLNSPIGPHRRVRRA